MSKQPLVSIVIPTYNRREKLLNCLKSVFASTYKNIEVIVINDYPHEDLSKVLKGFNIKLIQHKKEEYLVKCRNEGATKATGNILFFVDDDNILDRKAIENLSKKYLEIKNIGLLGPIMYNKNGELWFYGGRATWINPNVTPVSKEELKNELIETDAIPNAYMISKKQYIKIGGEDINFPTHSELDLAQRLKIQGYKNFIYTKASTIHDMDKARINLIDRPPFRMYITVKCNFLIERKYAPRFRFLIFLLVFVPIHMLKYLAFYIPFKSKNKEEYYKAYVRGLKEGLAAL